MNTPFELVSVFMWEKEVVWASGMDLPLSLPYNEVYTMRYAKFHCTIYFGTKKGGSAPIIMGQREYMMKDKSDKE